jgi:signal transduction histidine kinase/ActR/RegA family two-component response regulator
MAKKDSEQLDLRFNITLAVFFVALSLAGYLGFAKLRADLFAKEIVALRTRTEALTNRVDDWLSMRKAEVATLANTPTVRTMDWAVSGPVLKAKHERMPWFYIFAHINPDGSYYNSKIDFAKDQNLSDRAHFKASMQGQVYASDPVVSRTLGTDIVAVTSPIFRSDQPGAEIIGVFGGMIDTTTIVQELERFDNGPGSYAFAVNSTGIAIAHPDERRRGNINTKARSLADDPDPGLKALTAAMLQGRAGWLETTIDGRRVVASFVPVSEAQWFIATVTDAHHLRANLRSADYAGVAVFSLLCLAMALVVRYRRLEFRTLNQRREASEEKNRAKSVFLASMSHELRTPLNGILGYAQILLQRPGLSEGDRRYVQGILSSGQHLLSLINRILDLSKIETGKIELEPRPVDLASLLQELVRLFEIEKAKYCAGFRAEVDLGSRRVVIVDPERLRQIVINLVVNGFKYGNKSDVQLTVAIAADPAGGATLAIEVRDGGVGMTQEEVGRAFVAFEQVNRRSEGSGLGLAIVNELVSLMRGEIHIDSQPGAGTLVRVSLPVVFADEAVASSISAARGMPRGLRRGRPCVLLVDDNPANLDMLGGLLSTVGFEAVPTAGVDAAMAAFAERDFDLVITDLVMPHRDGFDLIRSIRSGSRAPATPIVVASASAFPDDQQRSLFAGANAFVAKPIEAIDLLQRIAALLELEYLYDEDALSPQSATPGGESSESVLRRPGATEVLGRIRAAAEVGQLRRVVGLVEGVSDPALKAALRSVLLRSLQEQDSDLLMRDLDAALGEPSHG